MSHICRREIAIIMTIDEYAFARLMAESVPYELGDMPMPKRPRYQIDSRAPFMGCFICKEKNNDGIDII